MSWKRITLLSSGFLLLAAGQSLGANDLAPAERVWYAQGLTHPMVVHIPIALLLSAAIAAILRVVFRSIPHSVVYYCLLIGTLGAIPSVIAGWAWAPQEDTAYLDPFDADSGIFWHRWGGIAVTAIGLLILAWATRQLHRKVRYEKKVALLNVEGTTVAEVQQTTVTPKPKSFAALVQNSRSARRQAAVKPIPRPGQFGWQFSVVLLAIAMGWVAHTGGEQVYPDNLENIVNIATGKELPHHIEKQRKRLAKERESAVAAGATQLSGVGAPGTQPAGTQPAGTQPGTTQPVVTQSDDVPPAATSIDFASQVWPIFEQKCIDCHGEEKNKGKLRMHTEELALAGGSDGPLYIKGNSEASLLIQLIVTDDEDEVMPPPEEDEKITDEELRILRQWVKEGAVWTPVTPTP